MHITDRRFPDPEEAELAAQMHDLRVYSPDPREHRNQGRRPTVATEKDGTEAFLLLLADDGTYWYWAPMYRVTHTVKNDEQWDRYAK